MNKFAHLVKTAEIRGVMAYLVDSGMVKVSSAEDFDTLVDVVSENVGGDYDLNDVLNKTAEVLEYVEGEGQEKVASEEDFQRAYGTLAMAKEAGEISDEEYHYAIANLNKEASAKERLWQVGEVFKRGPEYIKGKAGDAKRFMTRGFKGTSARARREGFKNIKDSDEKLSRIADRAASGGKVNVAEGQMQQARRLDILDNMPSRLRAVVEPAVAYGGTAAGLGGAYYGGKKLFSDEE